MFWVPQGYILQRRSKKRFSENLFSMGNKIANLIFTLVRFLSPSESAFCAASITPTEDKMARAPAVTWEDEMTFGIEVVNTKHKNRRLEFC